MDNRWDRNPVIGPSEELEEGQCVSTTCDMEVLLPAQQLVSGRSDME